MCVEILQTHTQEHEKLSQWLSPTMEDVRQKRLTFHCILSVLFESSYNAYTLFDLYFNKCVVYASPKRDCLIYGGNLDGGRTNGRSELSQQAFPNLYIKGLTVYLPKDSKIFYIYRLSSGHLRWPKDSIPGVKVIKDFRYRE